MGENVGKIHLNATTQKEVRGRWDEARKYVSVQRVKRFMLIEGNSTSNLKLCTGWCGLCAGMQVPVVRIEVDAWGVDVTVCEKCATRMHEVREFMEEQRLKADTVWAVAGAQA